MYQKKDAIYLYRIPGVRQVNISKTQNLIPPKFKDSIQGCNASTGAMLQQAQCFNKSNASTC